MSGTLLDDFLSSGPESLSDAQINAQIKPRSSSANPGKTTIQSKLEHIAAQAEAQEEKAEIVDRAVKTASHGVKVLAPILSALIKHDVGDVTEAMSKILTRVREDTAKVLAAYDLSPDDAPAWLSAQVSGQIVEAIIGTIERNNGAIIDGTDDYLEPLLALAKTCSDIGTTPYSQPNNPDISLTVALISATSDVMAEYSNFNYFHADRSSAAQSISDLLQERVVHGTIEHFSQRWDLNDSERSYLGVSLIRQAGRLLASAWADCAIETLSNIKSLSKHQRREVLSNGYPLDSVYERFEDNYQGIEVSTEAALRSCAPMREREIQPQQEQTPRGLNV